MRRKAFVLTLEEIRDTYVEILTAYNELFPVHPITRTEGEDITESFDKGNDFLIGTVNARFREISPKLREAANQSGNAVVWRRGDPLDDLPEGLKSRIEAAIKFGI
jgi:hypothetical protein